jgi:hypothetical protein
MLNDEEKIYEEQKLESYLKDTYSVAGDKPANVLKKTVKLEDLENLIEEDEEPYER